MSFKDPSEETFAAFGRLTIAFGRLESMVDWLMAMLALHRDGRGMTVDVWKGHLSRKLDRINELARAPGLPSQTQREVRSFARLVRQLSDERRQLVHAMVSWEMSSPPFPLLSVFRMGPKGYSQEFVHLEEVLHLAARIRSAVEDGMTLTNTASKLARAERTPEG